MDPEPFPEKSSWLCPLALCTPQQSKISSLQIAPQLTTNYGLSQCWTDAFQPWARGWARTVPRKGLFPNYSVHHSSWYFRFFLSGTARHGKSKYSDVEHVGSKENTELRFHRGRKQLSIWFGSAGVCGAGAPVPPGSTLRNLTSGNRCTPKDCRKPFVHWVCSHNGLCLPQPEFFWDENLRITFESQCNNPRAPRACPSQPPPPVPHPPVSTRFGCERAQSLSAIRKS